LIVSVFCDALAFAADAGDITAALALCAAGIKKSAAKVMAETMNISFLIRYLRSFPRNDDLSLSLASPGDSISSAQHGETKKKPRQYTRASTDRVSIFTL
jgi:hypothetical protein